MPEQQSKNDRTVYNLSDALTIAEKEFARRLILPGSVNAAAHFAPRKSLL